MLSFHNGRMLPIISVSATDEGPFGGPWLSNRRDGKRESWGLSSWDAKPPQSLDDDKKNALRREAWHRHERDMESDSPMRHGLKWEPGDRALEVERLRDIRS